MRACCLTTIAALAFACGATRDARAETFNTCQGFITTLPATITTQGVWCLRRDLATGITSGAAITIATNNVTYATAIQHCADIGGNATF